MTASRFFRSAAFFVIAALAASCASEPFGYADDRCVGGYNQCQTSCTDVGDGPARAACEDRCYVSENRCYGTGGDGEASLAVGSAIGEARSQREKEADFQRWKKQKEKESAEYGVADEQ